ncbi:hypothetical protein L1049_007325 [Liquidambar formosana]|uniref:Protein FAR1-RELATED SEQUENCE n=1 Tax=Liquidambar formosana TaxID=63359 RepID=A0AAP0WVA0_LIQFO
MEDFDVELDDSKTQHHDSSSINLEDIRNARRDARKATDGHDANMLNEHFLTQKERNSYFKYTIETDDENRISYIFWAETTSREEYKHFGDVVVFNTTYQINRYCIWHILNKFSKKLGAHTCSQYYESFRECIWDSEGPEEFECRWATLIERSELHKNGWLQTMFNKRDRYGELQADHVDHNEKPMLKTPIALERQMADIYTHSMFERFQDELWESMKYGSTVKVDDEFQTIYEVERRVFDGGKGTQRKQYIDLPGKYILKRWTKGAECLSLIERSGVNMEDVSDKGLLVHRNDLYGVFARVVDGAVLSVKGTEMLREDLLASERRIKSLSIRECNNNFGSS